MMVSIILYAIWVVQPGIVSSQSGTQANQLYQNIPNGDKGHFETLSLQIWKQFFSSSELLEMS